MPSPGRQLAATALSGVFLAGAVPGQSGVPWALEPCVEQGAAEPLAKAFLLRPIVAGVELQRRVERVQRELDWKRSLADACAESARRGRPILWLRALGDLEGFA